MPIFGFNLRWLEPPSKILPEYWCKIHELLANASSERDKYSTMVLLSSLSYSEHAQQRLVQTLLALATVPGLRILRAPRQASFQLADRYSPAEQTLTSIVERHRQDFHHCPESKLQNLPGEKKHDADKRRSRIFKSARDKSVRMFVRDPSKGPRTTSGRPLARTTIHIFRSKKPCRKRVLISKVSIGTLSFKHIFKRYRLF